MRQKDAIYGGEMSAHHYFKSFAYCDSGMIPAHGARPAGAEADHPGGAGEGTYGPLPLPGEINSSVADADEPWPGARALCAGRDCRKHPRWALLAFDTWRSTFGSRTRNR